MKNNKRKTYTPAQEIIFLAQVDRQCPLCPKPLFYKKNGKTFKNYEIAHIYPLNPTEEEKELLKNEELLDIDVNNENNLIPLCPSCHKIYDKPRTITEYRKLVEVKKKLINKTTQQELWEDFSIEKDLSSILKELYSDLEINPQIELSFDVKKITTKLNNTIAQTTKRKIQHNVSDYYLYIRERILTIDKSNINFSDIICLQIRTFYLKQQQTISDQQTIFDNIVNWIYMKTKPKTIDAAEILAAFFIQNCEIF